MRNYNYHKSRFSSDIFAEDEQLSSKGYQQRLHNQIRRQNYLWRAKSNEMMQQGLISRQKKTV